MEGEANAHVESQMENPNHQTQTQDIRLILLLSFGAAFFIISFIFIFFLQPIVSVVLVRYSQCLAQ